MLARLTASEYQEMQAYYSVEPWGEYREELRHGQRMAQYANYHRDPEKQPHPWPPVEFMNFTERPKETAKNDIPPEVAQARIDREVFGL